MKKESHLHIDVTVPFAWHASVNQLEAPSWLQALVYPKTEAGGNPLAAFLESVKPPCDVRIDIHLTVLPFED